MSEVGILYIESWLRGVGAAALYHKMEDAATAEISRAQLWQWIRNSAKMDDGRTVTIEFFNELLPDELHNVKEYVQEAIEIFQNLITAKDFPEFLTLPAYELI